MKIVRIYFLFLISICYSAQLLPEKKCGTESDVIIARLPGIVPVEKSDADTYLWDRFSKLPEIKLFTHYSTRDWKGNYKIFSQALVEKAKKEKFEFQSLNVCLEKLLQEPVGKDRYEIGYLPIGAYRSSRGMKQVWVIFCLWEYATDPSKVKVVDFRPPMAGSDKNSGPPLVEKGIDNQGWPNVGHIRIFTFDIENAELVGFVTCD